MIKQLNRYYNSAKIFKFFLHHKYIYKSIIKDLFEKKFGRVNYIKPRNIVLKLHSSCNARCEFCYATEDKRIKIGNLSKENWKKIIDDAKNIGCYTVTLSGGEPLIYPHLVELVEYVVSKKMLAFTTTNGIKISEKLIKDLEKAGLCALNFSILGPQKVHDEIVGIKGAFEDIVRIGEYCAKNTKIISIVNHVITKESIKNEWYKYVWDLMKKRGFRALNLLPICINSNNKANLLSTEELEIYDELAKKPYILMDTKNYTKPLCPAARDDLFVNDFGEVQPCPFIPVGFGNIKHDSLKSIFLNMQNHEMFQKTRSICMPARDMEFIDRYILPAFIKGDLPVKIKDLES